MAITDALKGANGAAPAAPAAESNAQRQTKDNNFKMLGDSLRAQMTDDQKAAEGSKSDKVAFVCSLGDPARPQPRRTGGKDVPSLTVVGYKFKILEDTKVPVAPLNPNWKSYVDIASIDWKPAKAGETVDLTIAETGIMISQAEYAGQFSGEGDTVVLSVKHSASRGEPMPVLRKMGTGSVKENMEEIGVVSGTDANGKKKYAVKPEYEEKFGVLYQKKSAQRKGTGSAKQAGEAHKAIAAAFRDLYAKKA